MPYPFLADAVVVLHLAFIVFAVLGGFLVVRWRRAAWFHLPAATWAAGIALGNWGCPLTGLEKSLREAGGGATYAGGFIQHYLEPVLYPSGLTRPLQIGLGVIVVSVNLLAYGLARRRP